MAEYLNKELFLQSMGLLGDETKYGNRDGEHQSRSYSTWMGYEIMDSVDDSIVEEDIVSVVRCKDCRYSKLDDVIYSKTIDGETNDTTKYCCFYRWDHNDWNDGEHFCSYGERKDNERKAD